MEATNMECAQLRELKKFLAEAVASSELTSDNELITVTRSSSDTYKVSNKELHAELLLAIWKQLRSKGCPPGFQLKLLQTALEHVKQALRQNKECEVQLETPGEPQYDLLKLQKFSSSQLDKLLLKLTDNAKSEQLESYAQPNTLCQDVACSCQAKQQETMHSAAAVKNKPRKMEDRNVCLERYGELYELQQQCRYFGVFDGHSGALSACYATSQLPQLLAEQLLKQQHSEDCQVDFYRHAFEAAFLQADARFNQKRITSGTTAVCALITQAPPQHLYIAWVGDSKALLVGQRTQLQLVKPHKPEGNEERRRIELSGGTVIHAQGQWRVNGILNVARSIGDHSLQAVIAEPDFVDVPLSEAHDFLLLGTDGLWDHVPETLIVDTVYACLAQLDTKLEDIPKVLVEAAKQHDSQDNITVVLVLLKPRSEIKRS
ncbi:CG10376 [Drosophila busckii]|uniref:CG10376 n=1 Tax=Drosophila busckii TaxID=30019 RepID=A0A0M4EPB5_DROBS|nr:protein phosphatase 1F [Drosophila busckii]ALC38662.1 CG10376 [Drosophila busckii]